LLDPDDLMQKRFYILAVAWAWMILPGGAVLATDSVPSPVPDNSASVLNYSASALDNSTPVLPVEATGEVAPPAYTDNTYSILDNTEIETAAAIRDQLEPVNRAIFVFNDKAYFWVMKPVARGYRAVVPEGARVSVGNFFSNLLTPIRFANNLLQGKFKDSGSELLRFTINSTIGMAGLFDVAKNDFHLERRNEDLGRTLGVYGLGHGVYIVLPLLGPSSLRDTAGLAGDAFLDPVNYLNSLALIAAVRTLRTENDVSLRIGEYEDLKKMSIDPYSALRDAYVQYRARKAEKPPPLSR